MAEAIPAVIIRGDAVSGGREQSIHSLGPGDQIASREWDPDRKLYVFWVRAREPLPASDEVTAAGVWDCDYKGHRFVRGNQCCMECGETYSPPGLESL